MRDEIRGAVLLVAGLAILGSAMLHGLVNVPHLHEDLIELGVRRTLMGAVMLLLGYACMGMLVAVGAAMRPTHADDGRRAA